MKCYIATYYRYNNYGTRLQNYALCKFLNSKGIEPITIYLINPKTESIYFVKTRIRNILSYLPNLTDKQKLWTNERKKNHKFKEFNKNLNLKKFNYKNLQQLNFKNAIAIAGSDQIWSPKHLKENKQDIPLFFLKFVPIEKRFAYAPSFGVSSISNDDIKLYKENLNFFKEISIRENDGRNIIENLINKSIPIMPDPVFLLTKEQWRSYLNYNNDDLLSDDFVLTYFLGIPDQDIINAIKKYANQHKYKIINITGNYFNNNDCIPSPDLFVGLIDKAKTVFTDSFHASAFSIIMNTPFLVFKRNDVKQFSRIETLLKKFDLEICKMEKNDLNKIEDYIKNIKLNNLENKLLYEQNLGTNFLDKIINTEGENNEE